MFSNIGGKIQTLAKIVCWLGIICSVIMGVILIKENSLYQATIVPGIILMVVGGLASWAGSFVLYGFGTLIENSEAILYHLNKDEK